MNHAAPARPDFSKLPTEEDIRRMKSTRFVIEALSPFFTGDLLDFGAGGGHYMGYFKKNCKTYTAMDIQNLPGIDVVGDVLDPPFEDNMFDTVISTCVMEHVRKPWVMAEQMKRVLRPGGIAINTAPFMYIYHSDPDDYFRISTSGMRALYEDIGMEVLLCAKFGGIFRILFEALRHTYLNPYKPRPWWKRRLFGLLEPLSFFLNSLCLPNRTYVGTIIVARKK